MTDIDNNTTDNSTIDKLDSHHRQQLSALMDGALSPDEARFLLRRLQHDGELSAYLERWQLAGDALRGQVDGILPAGFSGQVAEAIAREPAVSTSIEGKSRGWFGDARGLGLAALAASVIVAVLLFQRLPQQPSEKPVFSVAVSIPESVQASALEAPIAVDTSTSAASAPAIAQAATDASPVATSQSRPAYRRDLAAAKTATATLVATSTARRAGQQATPAILPVLSQVASTSEAHPFTPAALPQPRPWPRASLSERAVGGHGAIAGMFTASYGGARTADTNAYYPFEPQTRSQRPVAPSGTWLNSRQLPSTDATQDPGRR